MNRKRLKTIVATAAAGCLLLTMSVTAFASSGSGYESYKNAVESTILAQNATVDAQFEVKDNGLVILSGSSNVKLDNENSSSQTTLTADGVTKTIAASRDEATGAFVSRVDDKYYKMQKDSEKQDADQEVNDKLTASSSTVKLAEMLADTLAGDVKNQFVKDGQTVSLNLEGSQIPELAKLAVSAAAENNGRIEKEHNGDSADAASLKTLMDRIPKLSDTDVKSVSMTATVDGNLLKNNVATVVITGTDASGSTHELSIMVKGDISNVGNTKIDTIDTTGKNVTTISRNEHHED